MPTHLRDAHYRGAEALGHGAGYDYPHDHAQGWVDQQHRPSEIDDHVYYEPSTHGREAEIARRMQDLAKGAPSTPPEEYT